MLVDRACACTLVELDFAVLETTMTRLLTISRLSLLTNLLTKCPNYRPTLLCRARLNRDLLLQLMLKPHRRRLGITFRHLDLCLLVVLGVVVR